MKTANEAWLARLQSLVFSPEHKSAPRGMAINEQQHRTVSCDMCYSLVNHPERKLNPRFAAAEALWIMRGDNRVAPLAEHVQAISKFSDDGVTLAGAYGPRLTRQMRYVVDTLLRDRDSRQAVAGIWSENPAPSRDIPCTLSMTFMIRGDRMSTHVAMRSSDVWLGLPYDLFSFSAFSALILATYRAHKKEDDVRLGTLFLTAASSHLYEKNLDDATTVLGSDKTALSIYALPERPEFAGLIEHLNRMEAEGYVGYQT